MALGPRLDDLCEFIVDCPHRTAPTQATGIPQVRTTDINNGRLDLLGANKVSEATYQEWIARAEPSTGDLILAREAPVGQVGMVPPDTRVCLGQRTVLIRPDPGRIHPRFLLFLMLSPNVQAEMQRRGAGSTTPHLNVADIRQLRLPPLPDRAQQEDVAHVLGSLDDKNDVNRRIANTLTQIARALFKSWFEDFDPTRGTSTVPDDIRLLFPDKIIESRIGPVPDGWDVADLSALVSVSRETIDPREHPDENFDHFSIPAFDAGGMPSLDAGVSIKSVKLDVPPGSLLMSKLNPRIPRVWWPDQAGSRRKIASTEFVICLPRKPITRTYVYGLLTAPTFQTTLASLVRGTSGSHQRVSVPDLLRIPVVVPPSQVVARFDSLAAPMFSLREHLGRENSALAELRDTLLPKLISGEVRLAATDHGAAAPLESASAGS